MLLDDFRLRLIAAFLAFKITTPTLIIQGLLLNKQYIKKEDEQCIWTCKVAGNS